MTVKDLMTLLELYPTDAEVQFESKEGKVLRFEEINEVENKFQRHTIIFSVKAPERKLRLAK